jgi:hypothetical protein
VRDAEEVDWQGPGRPSRLPREDARIWVRVAGAWRAGHVHRWILGVDPEGWLAWTSYAHPGGYGHPQWSLFRYDEQTIRRRRGDQPPDAARADQHQDNR